MYQLIYTSAPRLLEAGKTGFGTVARSRELPQPLVAYLERISSYDRSENIGSFLYYGVYTMGGLVYHIFSRIADCGVDYTKRTNHIAHHWVMTDDEAGQSAHSANTPAGILLALQQSWLPSWQKLSQWFVGDIQVELHYPETGRTWETMTGQQDNQRWLNESDIQQGINLLLPATCNETDTLCLLHEAFLNRADHGWGIGFTTAATSTINRKNYPLFCITQAQQELGCAFLTGYQRIRVDHTLQPPVSIPIKPEPAIPVETYYQSAGAFSVNTFLPQQTAPPPVSPAPLPAEQPAYPGASPSKKFNSLTAACYAAIGVLVTLGVLCGAYWYATGKTTAVPAKTEKREQQSKPVSDSSKLQEQTLPPTSTELQKQKEVSTPLTEQQAQTPPPSPTESQKQKEVPTPTEQQAQTPPALDEAQAAVSPPVSNEYAAGEDASESAVKPKDFSIPIQNLKDVEIEVKFNENTKEFGIRVTDVQVPLHVLKPKYLQYQTIYHIHDGREKPVRDDRPATIIDKKERKEWTEAASCELQNAYKKYKDAELQYENAKCEYNSLQNVKKRSSSASRSRQPQEQRISKTEKNNEDYNRKKAEQYSASLKKQYDDAKIEFEQANKDYNDLREREQNELKKKWIVKFFVEEDSNDASTVYIKTEFCKSK